MIRFFDRLMVNEDGATMLEYAIMLALIGAALITAVTSLSTTVGSKFTSVSSTIGAS